MPRVDVSAVLYDISREIEWAMEEALKNVAPKASVDVRRLSREFVRRLEARAAYAKVDASDVKD